MHLLRVAPTNDSTGSPSRASGCYFACCAGVAGGVHPSAPKRRSLDQRQSERCPFGILYKPKETGQRGVGTGWRLDAVVTVFGVPTYAKCAQSAWTPWTIPWTVVFLHVDRVDSLKKETLYMIFLFFYSPHSPRVKNQQSTELTIAVHAVHRFPRVETYCERLNYRGRWWSRLCYRRLFLYTRTRIPPPSQEKNLTIKRGVLQREPPHPPLQC